MQPAVASSRSSWPDAQHSSRPQSPFPPDSKRQRRPSSQASPAFSSPTANSASTSSSSSSSPRSVSPVCVWTQYPGGDPPEGDRLCWYYAVRHCDRLDCVWLHCSYREAFDRLTDRRLPSPLPWEDDREYRSMRIWHPRMFRLPSRAGEEEEEHYAAVLTVPITCNAGMAYSRQTFVPALMHATGLREDGILVMLDLESDRRRLWGSVVLRGLKHRVERGWEAIIFLLTRWYGTNRAAPDLLPCMLDHMKLWCSQLQQHRDSSEDTRYRRTTRSENLQQQPPLPAPADPRYSQPEALLSSFHDVEYPRLFMRHVDTTPTTFSEVERSLSSFTPHLCVSQPLSSSPLSLHMREPRYIVSFPFPFSYWEWIIGRVGELRETMAALGGVDKQTIAVSSDRARSTSWVLIKAVVTLQQLDLLMEACFLLIYDAQKQPRRPQEGDAQPPPLQPRLQSWKDRRREEFRPEESLFALQSRGLRLPPLAPPPPPVLPRPENCRPCQGCNSARGCLDGNCAESHLSFAQHFGLLSSNLPVRSADIPRVTHDFSPVLALLPPSSSSSSSPAAAGFVLSIPLPRVPWIMWVLDKSPAFNEGYPAAADRLARLQRDQHHRVHGDNSRWHTVVAELPTLEAVDELLELVLYFVEDAHMLQAQDREAELQLRMQLFRQERRQWTGDRERQLLSLEMRGVSLRCPPLPPSPPAHPPPHAPAPQAPFSMANVYAERSSQPHPSPFPPPFPAFAEATFPPSKPMQPPPDNLQPDWLAVLTEMKQRGSFVTCMSDVLLPDFSSSDAAFVCSRADFLFACVPIPATETMRDIVYHQVMAGLPDIAGLEQRYGVQVFMPRLVDDNWKPRNAERLPWLNVCVRKDGTGRVVEDALDAALHCLIARCRRALHAPPPL